VGFVLIAVLRLWLFSLLTFCSNLEGELAQGWAEVEDGVELEILEMSGVELIRSGT
jgi:hypothetical protein